MIQLMTCPICRKAVSAEDSARSRFLPFCSERCRQIDFFRWSDGRYAIEESLEQRPDILEQMAQDEGELGELDG